MIALQRTCRAAVASSLSTLLPLITHNDSIIRGARSITFSSSGTKLEPSSGSALPFWNSSFPLPAVKHPWIDYLDCQRGGLLSGNDLSSSSSSFTSSNGEPVRDRSSISHLESASAVPFLLSPGSFCAFWVGILCQTSLGDYRNHVLSR